MTVEPIPYDICADHETSSQLLLGALLLGRPIAAYASDAPHVPPLLLDLRRVGGQQAPASG